MAPSPGKVRPAVVRFLDDAASGLTACARDTFSEWYEQLTELDSRIERVTHRGERVYRAHPVCQKLAAVPGIGPLTATALVATCPALSWADFAARVVTLHEGDRLTIRHDGQSETIYLKDIDCPELKQPHGKQAKHAIAAYLGNRDVVVRGLTRDKQGRVSAEVLLHDGRNVGRELLKEGLAWWQRSSSSDASLEVLEELARASGKGLWADSNPVPPWKWKATNKTSLKYSN